MKKDRIILSILLLFTAAVLCSCGKDKTEALQKLSITEVMPANKTAFMDEEGRFRDWFEITNEGEDTVSLKNCYLSDDPDALMSFAMPEEDLAAGESVLFYAVGAAGSAGSEAGNHLVPFKLKKAGDEIILSYRGETILSRFAYEEASDDVSILPDGTVTAYCTPGYPNTDEGYIGYQNTLVLPEGLIITEIANANDTLVPHDEYFYSDWVELYNSSGKEINLSDYYLSDDDRDIEKCRLPEMTVAPGAFVIIHCDDPLEEYKDFVSGFTLGSDDSVFLSSNGKVADAVHFEYIPSGGSFGRGMSGKKGYFTEPTPGSANGEPVLMVTGAAVPSVEEGIYNDMQPFSVTFAGEGTIYYTTDGSKPTRSSQTLNGPVTVDRTMVIRTLSTREGKLDGPVQSFSYIFNENHTLPVLSLSLDRRDLFDDETGIYVEGNHQNYYQPWVRQANLSFFDDSGKVFNADCGLQLFGGESRMICVKKSFRVDFKTKYGPSRVNADIFGNGVTKYKSLVIRGGEDAERTYFRTETFAGLSKDLDLFTQSGRFCILYVNGEYWGIYSLLERFSPAYLSEHCGVEEYTARVEKGMIEDDAQAYSYVYSLMEWAQEHDLSQKENFEYLEERIDLLSLIDWTIMEAYSRNGDISYNVRYCYTTDGTLKVTWALFDLDWAFETRGNSFFALAMERQFTIFAQRLLKNETFKQMFVDRMAELFRDNLTDDKILQIIDSYHDLLAPEVERDRARWNYEGDVTYSDWENSVDEMRRFVTEQNIREDMIESFRDIAGLTQEQEKTLREAIGAE